MNLGKENEQIEFKESASELYDALIDITAILNKHNCGTLYFDEFKCNGKRILRVQLLLKVVAMLRKVCKKKLLIY